MIAYQTVYVEYLLGEEAHDVTAVFSASAIRTDYGVPGSPTWVEFDNITLESLDIDGTEYSEEKAEATFGKGLIEAIDEAIDDARWEPDEPDYEFED